MTKGLPGSQSQASRSRTAIFAGFLGWTLDAFDFFVLTLVIDDVARSFGRTRPDIALAITATLSTRPIGALIFGVLADRYGRRLPLMINVVFYAMVSILSGFAPNYGTFIALRLLFGIGMGGEWGVGASLALESSSAARRGLISGFLQEGYAVGNLLAAVVFRLAYPILVTHFGANAWRGLFCIGGIPALLALYVRKNVEESDAWREHRVDWNTYRRTIAQHAPRFGYLVVFMTMMNLVAHGTQDMYPTLLASMGMSKSSIADITMISMFGAILGGLLFGHYSDRSGRRRAMIVAVTGALAIVPLWISTQNVALTILGVFIMQFFVQGAWGVVPAHLNELAPSALRGFFPGFAYQLGVLGASTIPFIESALGERFTYTTAMGTVIVVIFLVSLCVIMVGPEAKGVHFKSDPDTVSLRS